MAAVPVCCRLVVAHLNFVPLAQSFAPSSPLFRRFPPRPGRHAGQRWRHHLHHPHPPVWLADRRPHLLALHRYAHLPQRHPPAEGRLRGSAAENSAREREGPERGAGEGEAKLP